MSHKGHTHDSIFAQGCCGHDLEDTCCHDPGLSGVGHPNPIVNNPPTKVHFIGPTVKHGHPDFYTLLKEEGELHDKKNRDYTLGKDPLHNLRQCEKFGVPAHIGVLVRLTDKYSREETLALNPPAVAGESFLDVQVDKSVYSKIENILYKEFEGCPDKDTIIANLKENATLLAKWRKGG